MSRAPERRDSRGSCAPRRSAPRLVPCPWNRRRRERWCRAAFRSRRRDGPRGSSRATRRRRAGAGLASSPEEGTTTHGRVVLRSTASVVGPISPVRKAWFSPSLPKTIRSTLSPRSTIRSSGAPDTASTSMSRLCGPRPLDETLGDRVGSRLQISLDRLERRRRDAEGGGAQALHARRLDDRDATRPRPERTCQGETEALGGAGALGAVRRDQERLDHSCPRSPGPVIGPMGQESSRPSGVPQTQRITRWSLASFLAE